MQEAVLVLDTDKARGARTRAAHGPGFPQLLHRKIGASYLTHLSRLDQLVQRTKSVGDRNLGIGKVQLVKIDVFGAEAFEARIGGESHIFGQRATGGTLHLLPELGGDYHFSTPRAECASEKPLAPAVAIHVGGIEEIDSGSQCRIYDFTRS